jgi:hypothetical protein
VLRLLQLANGRRHLDVLWRSELIQVRLHHHGVSPACLGLPLREVVLVRVVDVVLIANGSGSVHDRTWNTRHEVEGLVCVRLEVGNRARLGVLEAINLL